MSKSQERRAIVEFVVGGSGRAYVPASTADVCVVVDSQDELQGLPDLPNIVSIPLGDHETVLTLLERASASDAEAAVLLAEYRLRPNVYLSAGMAQDPRLGACAVRDAAHRGQLEPSFQEILVRLLEATNGQLSLVVIREVNSNAGGMGSGGSPEIGSLFQEYITRKTNAQVWQHMLRIGGLTFLPVAKRAAANTAYATRRNVNAVLSFRVSRLTRDLEFVELPLRSEGGTPIRDKRTLRDGLVGPMLVARYAVSRLLDAREVNHKTETALGEMRRMIPQWSTSLDEDRLSRAAATEYRARVGELRKERERRDMVAIAGVRVDLEPATSSLLPSLDEVTSAIRRGNLRDPLFDRLAEAEPPEFHSTVWIEVTRDEVMALDETLSSLTRPEKLSDVTDALRRFGAVGAHLEHALSGAEAALQSAERTMEKRRARTKGDLRRLRSPLTTFERAVSPRAMMRRYSAGFGGLIRDIEELGRARSRVIGLRRALERVRADARAYEEMSIGRVEHALDQFIGGRPIIWDAIEVTSLESTYIDLLNAVSQHDSESCFADRYMKPHLLRSISRVTLAGIAQMLGVPANPEDIVAGLLDERFAWKAPQWGGETQCGEPREQFVVFPPMSRGDLAALDRVANQRRVPSIFIAADTVAAGCSIVALAFYPVVTRDDVEPPLYAQAESTLGSASAIAV
jgi:hypothetical protein